VAAPAFPLTGSAAIGHKIRLGYSADRTVSIGFAPGMGCTGAVQARWVAAGARGSGPGGLGLWVDNQVAVAHRRVSDREFEEAVKEHAAAPGAAPVEAEGEFVQVALQVRRVHRALVGAEQPPLCQRRDAMNPGQQLAGVLAAGTGRALAAPLVRVAECVDPAVTLPGIGDDGGAGLDVLADEPVQRGGRGVVQIAIRQRP
jgi:hypothetical protein